MTRYSLALIPVALLALIFGLGRLADKARVVAPAALDTFTTGTVTHWVGREPLETALPERAGATMSVKETDVPTPLYAEYYGGVLKVRGSGTVPVEINGAKYTLTIAEDDPQDLIQGLVMLIPDKPLK